MVNTNTYNNKGWMKRGEGRVGERKINRDKGAYLHNLSRRRFADSHIYAFNFTHIY